MNLDKIISLNFPFYLKIILELKKKIKISFMFCKVSLKMYILFKIIIMYKF